MGAIAFWSLILRKFRQSSNSSSFVPVAIDHLSCQNY